MASRREARTGGRVRLGRCAIGVLVAAAVLVVAPPVVRPASATGAASGAPPTGVYERIGTDCLTRAEHVTEGPDGAAWFTTTDDDEIHRRPAGGTITTFTGQGIDGPRGIVTGPDGALWFASTGETGTRIGRITTGGAVTTYTSAGMDGAYEIVVGSDGALWFSGLATFGRVTTAGVITLFPGQGMAGPMADLTVGPDGAIWVLNATPRTIGRVATDGSITKIVDDGIGLNPTRITTGSDGALWFTPSPGLYSGGLHRMTTAGVLTYYGVDPSLGPVSDVVSGPDGALWFTLHQAGRIGRMTTAGAVTVFAGTGIADPRRIASVDGALSFLTGETPTIGRLDLDGTIESENGSCARNPDQVVEDSEGRVWFTNEPVGSPGRRTSGATLGRIHPDGTIDELISPLFADPSEIVEGPDGAMWFVNGKSIGRIGDDDVVSVFTGGLAHGYLRSIVAAPDGVLWFTDPGANRLVRLTTAGVMTITYGPGISFPSELTVGPDGAVWFTNVGNDTIGRVSSGGVVTNHPGDGSIDNPVSIDAGPDGALWFVNRDDSTVGRMAVDGTTTSFPVPGPAVTRLTAGADGRLWISGEATIRRMSVSGALAGAPDLAPRLPVELASSAVDGSMWVVSHSLDGSGPSLHRLGVVGLPGAVLALTASAGKEQATIAWTEGLDGASPITSVHVVAAPGGRSCTTPGGTAACTISGLTAGTSYSFTATATNVHGAGSPAVSNAIVPWSGSAFHGVAPTRLLDSRTSKGGWSGPLQAGTSRTLQVGGSGGVPTTATAVVLNVTVTGASAMSYLSVYPAGSPRPTSSSINFLPGDTRANLVTVKLGTGGKVSFANAVASTHVIVDVSGYYDEGVGGLFTAIAPYRALDSRIPGSHPGWNGPLTAGSPAAVVPDGFPGAPERITGVVVNVTATQATNDTFITVYSKTGAPPLVSNLNVRAGDIVANLAVVATAPGMPYIELANAVGSVHVIVDVVGYFTEDGGSRLHPISPVRVLDDRNGTGLSGPWGHEQTRTVAVAGSPSIPSFATGVAGNVTVTGSSNPSFVSAFPAGGPRPLSSTLNFSAGQTVANATYVGLGGGKVSIFNAVGSVHVIADVTGYFAPY